MIYSSVLWSNLPAAKKLFVVSHRKRFEGCTADDSSTLIICEKWDRAGVNGNYCFLATERTRRELNLSGFGIVIDEMPRLDDGDVVYYDSSCQRLEIVYQIRSSTNSLYVTNACNSRCQFCPQPSTNDDGSLYDVANGIIDLVENGGDCVNITGGEPTVNKNEFLFLLRHAAQKWPNTKMFVLSNGRLLDDVLFVDKIYDACGESPIGFGIPLYSDAAGVHDGVVGVNGAYGQTIKGLYNLARVRAEIEIRFVVSKLTYKRLPNLIEFIGRNLPFIARVAVMGMEPMGYCRDRWNDFWIDPADCEKELVAACVAAQNHGIDLFLYNFQLCCLPMEIRRFACSSISEWKRVYVEKCWSCPMLYKCGGFFASQNEPMFRPRRFT